MNRRLLPTTLGAFIVALGFAPLAQAINVLSPQDFIIAIDTDPPASNSGYPGAENPPLAIDGTIAKYLNTGGAGSGFIVTPSESTTVQSFQLTTANDIEGRDPASFELWGTNDAIVSLDNSDGLGENWTLIDAFDLAGGFALPAARDTVGPVVPITNGTTYSSYKMLYPEVKGAPLMQIAEASFFESNDGTGIDILDAGDPIIAVHFGPASRYPDAESPQLAIDGVVVGSKYLNFGKENSGFIVTPVSGALAVNGFQITTANDAEERDPGSWELYGTNDPIASADNSQGDQENWTLVGSGALALPIERDTAGAEVAVANATAYSSYRMVFTSLKNTATANSMQIAEVQFFADGIDAFVEVNRDTGVVRLVTNENTTIGGYEIESNTQGMLDDTAWTSITGSGADANDDWMIDSAPGDPNHIAESDGPGGANDGLALTTGSPIDLGSIWRRAPLADDLVFRLLDESGTLISNEVVYVGAAVVLGDYNGDGFVSALDWPTFRAGMGSDSTGMSPAQAYFNSDLNGDLVSDLVDFNLFVEAAGGFAALFGTGAEVPEPSTFVLLGLGIAALGYRSWRRSSSNLTAVLAIGLAAILSTGAQAQTFTNVGAPSGGSTTPDPIEAGNAGPVNLFDDTFLDTAPGQFNDQLFNVDYAGGIVVLLQYAGLGVEPKTVFMDYGSEVSANWFAYAQRAGGIPTADRVGKFEFWFSNTDFGGVLPGDPADSVFELKPDDPRVLDSILRPYPLGRDDLSGRYVAMRVTISDISNGVGNIGGHEFRLMQGPSDIVLEIDRSNGNMTMRNDGTLAQLIDIKAYELRSDLGGLDPSGFNGVGGDDPEFTLGDGMGNGWELGGAMNNRLLLEANFAGNSMFPIAGTTLQLGMAYNEDMNTEDVMFKYTNSMGHVYDGRVEYVGMAPNVPGDHNGDGVVNAADYAFGRDQIPGFYPAFHDNFGAGSGSGTGSVASSVPEPGSLGMLAVGLAIVGAVGARRRFT